mmetsp:Transcript_36829/g.82805  ORF Transcript_36829/g.82805 Transcript_36829/m.82805 type:complete len:416 (-) Transcript_36829:347-1594(-)
MFDGAAILDGLPDSVRAEFARDFNIADEGFRNGRVASTTQTKEKYRREWFAYCKTLGVDPHLEAATTRFQTRARVLSGFAARTRRGAFGRGRQIAAGSVASAITAVGQAISLDTGVNPTKNEGSKELIYPLQVMMSGFKKEDPATVKKLPIEVDVPEYLASLGRHAGSSERDQAIGDLSLIGFYYLLRSAEYTKNRSRDEKQTVEFRVIDVTFFKRDGLGKLRQLPRNASKEDILAADSATLRLTNQKNGWKGVCINHHVNGESYYCPVKALARRVLHIRAHSDDVSLGLHTFFNNKSEFNITDADIRAALKFAAKQLNYPERGIPIDRIDTHSLRCGGANALSLAGYSDRAIMKMGRWQSKTFLEYISSQLSEFSQGMSVSMSKVLNFVNVEGGVCHDITNIAINTEYANAAAA